MWLPLVGDLSSSLRLVGGVRLGGLVRSFLSLSPSLSLPGLGSSIVDCCSGVGDYVCLIFTGAGEMDVVVVRCVDDVSEWAAS